MNSLIVIIGKCLFIPPMLVQVYGSKRLDAILIFKRSTGVAPEVNLRNPLHAGEKLASTLALKLRACIKEIRNGGISSLIKGLMSPKNVLKKKKIFRLLSNGLYWLMQCCGFCE